MRDVLADRDLGRVVDVLDAMSSPVSAQGGVPVDVLVALARLVPTDLVTFFDMDGARKTCYVIQDWDGRSTNVDDVPSSDPDLPFWRHFDGSPSCCYPIRTGDDRTVVLRTDLESDRELRASPMYVDVTHANPRYEMFCWMPVRGSRSPRFLFWRDSMDFTDRERLLITLLRPHLVEMRERHARSALTPLTPRQLELMRLVAAGRSTTQIAAALYLSPHTVRKHLENIFERLGVSTRAAAVARVNDLG
jgi:DNA-binding CsgD family transcriptional regulator